MGSRDKLIDERMLGETHPVSQTANPFTFYYETSVSSIRFKKVAPSAPSRVFWGPLPTRTSC